MITVVFTIKDRPFEMIKKTLEGLRRQESKLIVVDYGSKDTTWHSLIDKKELIIVKKNTEIFNYGRALNIGIKKVKTPYVITIDGDIFLPDGVVEMAVEELKKRRCMVLCQRYDLNEDGSIGGLHSKNAVGTFIGMRTEWIKKVRGFDEYYTKWGSVDLDLRDRAIRDGLEIVWLDKMVYHQYHESTDRSDMHKNIAYYQKNKSIIRNLKKWGI